jgi:hypothetical protein
LIGGAQDPEKGGFGRLFYCPAVAELRAMTGKMTLLYGARDPKINHAVAAVLKPKRR